MAAPAFEDDLFDFHRDGASMANEGSLGSSERRRRKKGSRSGSAAKDHQWWSGAVPAAPEFDGDVERNPLEEIEAIA